MVQPGNRVPSTSSGKNPVPDERPETFTPGILHPPGKKYYTDFGFFKTFFAHAKIGKNRDYRAIYRLDEARVGYWSSSVSIMVGG